MDSKKKILVIVAVVVVVLVIIGIIMMASKKVKPEESKSASPSHSSFLTRAANPMVSGITVNATPGETTVSWNPLEGADHYTMYYSPKKDFAKEEANLHDPITETSAVMGSDVPMGYYFKLSATVNQNGTLVETPLSAEHYMQLDAVSA
jgi:hypothetical protein